MPGFVHLLFTYNACSSAICLPFGPYNSISLLICLFALFACLLTIPLMILLLGLFLSYVGRPFDNLSTAPLHVFFLAFTPLLARASVVGGWVLEPASFYRCGMAGRVKVFVVAVFTHCEGRAFVIQALRTAVCWLASCR